jgi:outer membrane protein TolC
MALRSARSLAAALLLVAAPIPAPAAAPASAPAPAAPPAPAPATPPAPPAAAAPPSGLPAYALPDLIARVDRHNLDYRAQQTRLAQAEAGVRRAWAALLPVATAAASYTRNSVAAELAFPDFTAPWAVIPDPAGRTDPATGAPLSFLKPMEVLNIEIQPRDQLGALARVSMPVLLMPAYYAIASADQAVELTQRQLAYARDEYRFATAQAYYGAVAARRLIELSENQLRLAGEQEKLARARFEAGQVAKVAYLRAGVDRARAEQDLVRARNADASAKVALQTLVGLEGDFEVAPPSAATDGFEMGPAAAEAYVRTALERRKDLQASRDAVELAERAVKINWWKFAPAVTANGEYRWTNVEGFTGENTTWLVTLAAGITLYDGTRYADLRDSRAKADEARLARDALARRVVGDVKNATLDLESARANEVKAREQERLAVESAAIVDAQFAAGMATYLDAADAANQRFAAGVAALTEELNVRIASLRLAKAMGQLGEHVPAPGSETR